MKYYPKNKIKTNLYTQGGEYINSETQEVYVGYYYELYNGKFFSGKEPGDYPNTPLIKQKPYIEEDGKSYIVYNKGSEKIKDYLKLNGIDPNSKKIIPQSHILTTSNINYEKNKITRYFLKQINKEIYLEVNEKTFNNINEQNNDWYWEKYIPFKLVWVIKGSYLNVERENKKRVEDINRIWGFKKFHLYLNENYTKYLKS